MAISNSVRLHFLRIHPVKKLRVEQTFHPHLYEASTLYIEFSANNIKNSIRYPKARRVQFFVKNQVLFSVKMGHNYAKIAHN